MTQALSDLDADAAAWLPGDTVRTDPSGKPVLMGCTCRACGTSMFPTAPVCPSCMSEDLETVDLPGTGTLYSFTEVHVGPAQWTKPLTLGYVDLGNGVRVFSHLVSGTGIRIGAPVAITAGRVGRRADGTPIETFLFEAASPETTPSRAEE